MTPRSSVFLLPLSLALAACSAGSEAPAPPAGPARQSHLSAAGAPPAHVPDAPVAPPPRAEGPGEIRVLNYEGGEELPVNEPVLFRLQAGAGTRNVKISVNRREAGKIEARSPDGEFRFSYLFPAPGDFDVDFAAFGDAEDTPVATVSLRVRLKAPPPPPAPPRGSRFFNAYVLKAVEKLNREYGLLGYGRDGQFTHDLDYYNYGVLHPTRGGLTMCVAGVMEVILTALELYYQDTGDHALYDYLPFASWSSLKDDGIKARIWVNPKLHSSGTADALAAFGMGERMKFRDLEPGAFINLNRTTRTGHAVVFLGFIDAKGRDLAAYGPAVAGFRYFGAQGKKIKGQGGFDYRHAFFSKSGCPDVPFKRDCKIIYSEDSRLLDAGQMLVPSEWSRGKSVVSDTKEPLPDGIAPASPADFDGETTDD